MVPGQSLSQLTAKILVKLAVQFGSDRPDLILAHGDTTTCFATAVSSFYHQIPFFHVEAGLRTHKLTSPFPEEFNRRSIAPIATHHFAPTLLEKENLLNDGIATSSITITGSTVHEAVSAMQAKLELNGQAAFPEFPRERPVVVTTLHRREGAQSFAGVLAGLRTAARMRPEAVFVCPVHPNPSVQKAFRNCLGDTKNIVLTEPLPYPKFLSLMLRSQLVVTDSGGVQEEASFIGKPVLLVREETERTDGIQAGLVKLVGLEPDAVRKAVTRELSLARLRTERPLKMDLHEPASEIIANEVLRAVK